MYTSKFQKKITHVTGFEVQGHIQYMKYGLQNLKYEEEHTFSPRFCEKCGFIERQYDSWVCDVAICKLFSRNVWQ